MNNSFSVSQGNDTTIESNESVFSFTSTIQDLGGVVNNLLFEGNGGIALSPIPEVSPDMPILYPEDLEMPSSNSLYTTGPTMMTNSALSDISYGGKKKNKSLDEITKDVMKITHILKKLKINKIEKKAKKSRKYKNKHKSKKTFKKSKK